MKTRTLRNVASLTALAALIAIPTGCATDAQTGTIAGAGIGAVAGQAIGRDTEATLIGTAIGTVAGYMIGNEMDKSKQRQTNTYDW